jgi:hypothetical protein
MKKKINFSFKVIFITILFISLCINFNKCEPQSKSGIRFEISFPSKVHPADITGRIYVLFSKTKKNEPRLQRLNKTDVQIWGKNIFNLKPGKKVSIDENVFGYPLKSVKDIPLGEYYIQGFVNIYTEFKRSDGHTLWMHNDQWEGQKWNISPGNIYSDVKKVSIDPSATKTIKISCDNVIPPIKVPPDTKWVKRIKFQSKMLSEFWGQPVYLGATILLPKGYDTHPEVYYPVNYVQGHFSLMAPHRFRTDDPGEEDPRGRKGYEFYKFWISDDCPRIIAVTFQHPCPYFDDSYAVNSPNVGPYGDAIMNELIPYVEERFRIIRKPYARVLSGGSTGGWESLALQVFHPDFFGGTWSLCPDPVDFRYFASVNIYEDKNAHYKEFGWAKTPIPIDRSIDGIVTLTFEQQNHMELVMGTKNRSGEQIDIFEAVFGPIGPDGYVKPLIDKLTGEIDHSISEYWREHYDLRYYLEKNWSWLGPKLEGKLHIYVGDMDTFYLNNAVVLLEDFLEKTKNPYYAGVVEYGDRKPHCWGPGGAELIKLFEEHITKNAPKSEDTSKWKY